VIFIEHEIFPDTCVSNLNQKFMDVRTLLVLGISEKQLMRSIRETAILMSKTKTKATNKINQ